MYLLIILIIEYVTSNINTLGLWKRYTLYMLCDVRCILYVMYNYILYIIYYSSYIKPFIKKQTCPEGSPSLLLDIMETNFTINYCKKINIKKYDSKKKKHVFIHRYFKVVSFWLELHFTDPKEREKIGKVVGIIGNFVSRHMGQGLSHSRCGWHRICLLTTNWRRSHHLKWINWN